ncbi:hypothetical protein ACFZB5_13640 [Streptomyces nodosus]|uniref:hypothetical protein n=1 Tax=Streptomyces nodosus TaxID=40318 RepID=UPI0036EDADFF
MTYSILRKPPPEHEPDPVEEQLDEAEHEPEPDAAVVDEQPTSWPGALRAGMLGPGTWLAARFGTGTAWTVHLLGLWAFGFYGGWVAMGLLVVWLGAVALFLPREFLDRLAHTIEQKDGPPPQPPADSSAGGPAAAPAGPLGEAWWEFVIRSMGDRQGVHLRDLLRTLHGMGHHPDWEVADVRRVCEAAGVPVRGRVRVRGLGVTVGVHRDDLRPPSEPSPGRGHEEPPEELHLT